MAEQPKAAQDSAQLGCTLVVLIVVLIASASTCSKDTSQTSGTGLLANTVDAGNAADAEQQPPPQLQPLSLAAARLGYRRLKLVYSADGANGAEIYSRNCYDALGHQFSWAKLDQCGAFDMAAVKKVDSDDSITSDESSYFGPETAAGRYLAAATGAGEPADDADQRLAAVQRHVPKAAAPAVSSAETGPFEPDANATGTDLNMVLNELEGE